MGKCVVSLFWDCGFFELCACFVSVRIQVSSFKFQVSGGEEARCSESLFAKGQTVISQNGSSFKSPT